MTLLAALERSIARAPGAEAIIDGAVRMTYDELGRSVRRVASALATEGAGKGTRIAFVLENSWQAVVLHYAAMAVGAITVPVNTRLAVPELAAVLEDAAPELVVATGDGVGGVLQAAPHATVWTTDDDVARWLREGEDAPLIAADPAAEDPVAILYTSGTTGAPKGVVQTHRNCLATAAVIRRRTINGRDDRTLVAAPIYHATGLNAQVHGYLSAGGSIVLRPRFETADALETIEREQITYLAGVPTMLRLLANAAQGTQHKLASVRTFTVGGAAMVAGWVDEFRACAPSATVANVWGATEVTSVATWCEVREGWQDGMVGAPVDGVTVSAIDPGTGATLPAGEVGELVIRGPGVTQGYWRKPEETERAFQHGGYRSGDLGHVAPNGTVTLVGRARDLIIRGGENIYPVEIEAVVARHPSVADVAVVGHPHPIFQEVVAAVVVVRDGQTVSESSLRAFAAESLADYKVPVTVTFMPDLPRNAAGKVDKAELRRRLGQTEQSGRRCG